MGNWLGSDENFLRRYTRLDFRWIYVVSKQYFRNYITDFQLAKMVRVPSGQGANLIVKIYFYNYSILNIFINY